MALVKRRSCATLCSGAQQPRSRSSPGVAQVDLIKDRVKEVEFWLEL